MQDLIDSSSGNESGIPNTKATKMQEVKMQKVNYKSELAGTDGPVTKNSVEAPPQLKFKDDEVDTLLQSFSTEKFEKKYDEYTQKYTELDKADQELVKKLAQKMKAAGNNALQGVMGFPFAASKIPDLKEIIKPLSFSVAQQYKEALKVQGELDQQDKSKLKVKENKTLKLVQAKTKNVL